MYHDFNRPCGPCEYDRRDRDGDCHKCGDPHCDSRRKPECEPGCVIPPPIPPIKFIPGLNTQEQMVHVVNKANEAICTWNSIREDCCAALDKMVGAAVTNNVYYSRHDVCYADGYNIDDNASYATINIKAVDSGGKPIFVHLIPAFGNEGNSGVRQNLNDASFITSSNAMLTAVDPTVFGWKGPAMMNGKPVSYTPDDPETESTYWVAGFNRHGVLVVFPADVDPKMLTQSRMVNCIGPVYPIVQDGKPCTDLIADILDVNTPMAVQAIGWRGSDCGKIMFSCGKQENRGMKLVNVAAELVRMGCTTAVVTCAMEEYPSGVPAPIGAAPVTENNMTGGMAYIGKLTDVPLNYQVPYNSAFWTVSRKPGPRWSNEFTAEIADLCQLYGSNYNQLTALGGAVKDLQESGGDASARLDRIEDDIADINADLENAKDDITILKAKTDELTEKVATLETGLSEETQNRIEADQDLSDRLTQEETERKAEDTALSEAITAEQTARENADATEKAAREAADETLENEIVAERNARINRDQELTDLINAESTARNQGDQNLIEALQNEANARATQDAALESKVAAAVAASELADQEQNKIILGILDGTKDLPKATDTQFGVVKLGTGLTIGTDGELNITGGGGGDTITAGDGITITETGGTKTVSVTPDTFETKQDADTFKAAYETDKQNQKTLDDTQSAAIAALETGVQNNTTSITNISNEVEKIIDGTTPVKAEIPIASATVLGGIKVGANLTISADGTLSGTPGGQGGETVAGGTGITVEHTDGVATVSVDTDIIATAESVRAAEAAATTANNDLEDKLTADLNDETAARVAADTAAGTRITQNETDIAALQDQVDEISGDTSPFVKKTGDAMTGSLIVSGDGNGFLLRNSTGPDVDISIGRDGPTIAAEADALILAGKLENGGRMKISSVNDGTAAHDAVNKAQLDALSVSAANALDTAKAELSQEIADNAAAIATNTNNIAQHETRISSLETTSTEQGNEIEAQESRISAVEGSIEKLEDGTMPLPYVKKAGDTMSGPLHVERSGYKANVGHNGVSFTSEVGEASSGVMATANVDKEITGLSLNSPGAIVVNGGDETNKQVIRNIADGSMDNDAATIAQLTARVAALEAALTPLITQAQDTANEAKEAAAGGPFLPLSGGTMTGNVKGTSFQGSLLSEDTSRYLSLITYALGEFVYKGFGSSARNSATSGGQILQNIATPVNPLDAANKAYVDNSRKLTGNPYNTSSNQQDTITAALGVGTLFAFFHVYLAGTNVQTGGTMIADGMTNVNWYPYSLGGPACRATLIDGQLTITGLPTSANCPIQIVGFR